MAKKRRAPEKKKNQKKIPIDCIPKHSQQPRSSPPKRRTDFSVFTSTPASLSNPVSSLGSSSGEVRLNNVSASSLRDSRTKGKQFPEGSLVKCSDSQRDGPGFSSKFLDVPVIEVESDIRDEGLDLGSTRDGQQEKSDTLEVSESTPQESPVTDCNFIAVTPGSVVWAKTACQMWWPAEIMEERSTSSDRACDGHVLVQFYGNHPRAWIDPVKDLSAFEDSFEERSSNPSKDFQDALKQALQRKEQLSSCRKLSPCRSVHSERQDHSSDKWATSTSSRTIDDLKERGRGKRERKRKLHFDEVASPSKLDRKARRLKIMRYLGLMAPVGSPY
ncbi:PWWP domain-containing protein 2A-like isoform X1 [Senna tora]|uniref:PWWP domain-containing protein 2A-like isoform X1 n=1 Tax=Senna tora TaxID=362788 RepID=A0A834TBQ0_9FABA|nr:PWWP domain-containing protein 2A-like isoform X1 [Senna tora]